MTANNSDDSDNSIEIPIRRKYSLNSGCFYSVFERMFSVYKEAVVRDYQSKKSDGTLSLNLMKPTPASIKRECLIVLEKRIIKDDIKTLRLFFGEKENIEDYERAIRHAEINKFKPISNFLRNQKIDTDSRNIELLAFLIDFSPRPYRLGFSASDIKPTTFVKLLDHHDTHTLSNDDAIYINGGSGSINSVPQSVGGDYPEKSFVQQLTVHKRKILIAMGAIVVGAIGISFNKFGTDNSVLSFLKTNDQCMYWSVDHYIQADCDMKPLYGQLVALDILKVDNFKKIKRPDTLTENDINKVWYLKTNNEVELYTSDGKHPEQPHRRLRPLSKYMFNKYVVGKKVRIN